MFFPAMYWLFAAPIVALGAVAYTSKPDAQGQYPESELDQFLDFEDPAHQTQPTPTFGFHEEDLYEDDDEDFGLHHEEDEVDDGDDGEGFEEDDFGFSGEDEDDDDDDDDDYGAW